jgi:hypothetical protein
LRPDALDRANPAAGAGRYNVAKLIEKHGDARLPELLQALAQCPKGKSHSIYDQCKVVYGKDSRF